MSRPAGIVTVTRPSDGPQVGGRPEDAPVGGVHRGHKRRRGIVTGREGQRRPQSSRDLDFAETWRVAPPRPGSGASHTANGGAAARWSRATRFCRPCTVPNITAENAAMAIVAAARSAWPRGCRHQLADRRTRTGGGCCGSGTGPLTSSSRVASVDRIAEWARGEASPKLGGGEASAPSEGGGTLTAGELRIS